jgi:serine/threonine protein kinase
MADNKIKKVDRFDLAAGRILARKYEVVSQLGAGWEGEVYLVREVATGIERTAKIFFPQRNPRDRAVRFYAKKLHKLRHCPIVIQYSAQDQITVKGVPVTLLISEYVEGELLSQFVERQPGKRLQPYQALHVLHALACGMECVHRIGEYHGDLHTDNIILQRYGLGFDMKLVDLFQSPSSKRTAIQDDTIEMIRIFYEILGDQKHYAKQPKAVKDIICGMKHSLILKKFKSASQLRNYIETMEW